ncbi:siphovirus ReqiPepy6 Gp37-like family protein [Savagea faecisuis]|uniref:Siphovirus ReqiPepy6 Gp37-like family protein n=1 Tax=Savagea faecisuis TaxID=1274803 RepID=A0ABW3H119_9BACL
MKPIRILTPTLDLVGEIDNYLSFSFSRNYHRPGEFQLVTNNRVQHADKLFINQLVMVGNDPTKTGIIRYKEIQLNEEGEEILTVKGFQLGDIFKQRITFPSAGAAYDLQNGPAESVMKHLVKRNCIELVDMAFSFLEVESDFQRGSSIEWQSRYKNLGEELEQISRFTNVGWHVIPDLTSKKWVFDVYNGRNFSAEQSEQPPVLFSTAFDNVQSQAFIDNILDYGNQAVVGGKGEGAAREIVLTETTASGLDLHVVFVEGQDSDESGDMLTQGEQQLSEHPHVLSFQSKILPYGPFRYQKDWDVGDLVTIQQSEWGLQLTTRVTEVQEIYERDGLELHVTFGSEVPTFADKTKQKIKQLLQSKR